MIDVVRKLSEFLKREADSATEGDLQNYLLLGAIPFCASQSQRVGPAGLARKPERSAAQGVRDSNTTGLFCGSLCFVATGRGPAGLATKPEQSAAQGMRDSNTTGLSCGLLCFMDTGRRVCGPAGLAGKPERSAAQGMRDSNTTGLPWPDENGFSLVFANTRVDWWIRRRRGCVWRLVSYRRSDAPTASIGRLKLVSCFGLLLMMYNLSVALGMRLSSW